MGAAQRVAAAGVVRDTRCCRVSQQVVAAVVDAAIAVGRAPRRPLPWCGYRPRPARPRCRRRGRRAPSPEIGEYGLRALPGRVLLVGREEVQGHLGATAHVPAPPRHLRGLGGLRGAGRPARRLPARPARALRGVRLRQRHRARASTATSARAACTPGSPSTSTPPRASRPTAASWSARPTWSRRTAARCPASTATGRPAASCCPRMFGAGGRRPLRGRQGPLRPAGPDEPRQGRPPGAARPSTCGSAGTGRRADRRRCSSPTPTTAHSFGQAANRCVGVGKCRKHENDGGTVMCPSYQVTHEEEHSTRGRARLLFEMLDGHGDGADHGRLAVARRSRTRSTSAWPARAARPTARPTSTWRRTRRSSSPSTTGTGCGRAPTTPPAGCPWPPRAWPGPGCAGASTPSTSAAGCAGSAHPGRRPGGPRPIPAFATADAPAVVAPPRPDAADAHRPAPRGTVLLWPDTFTNHFHPQVGRAAVEVLEAPAGRSTIPTEPLCCGLTWISTGQLGVARRVLRRTVRRARAARPRRRSGRSGSSPAARRSSAPTLPSSSPTTRTRTG